MVTTSINANTGPAIEATDLVKAFGATPAVSGVHLTVASGSVFGILGPNGAGKTTLIRMLATLLRPDSGVARIFGYDVVREASTVRSLISLTGQFAAVDEDFSAVENLVLLGRLLGFSRHAARTRADELLDTFGLTDASNRPVKSFSGGMRRLDIAASIVVTPHLLVLDEPTTGLDPRSRNQVWEVVRLLTRSGTTVLLTTQYLDEADQVADRIAVMDEGRIIAEGTPGELKASVGAGTLRVRVTDTGQRSAAADLLARALAVPIRREPDPAAITA
jgi:ABC-2 type transport system ATP-binding protein